jgi:hypothetical protein
LTGDENSRVVSLRHGSDLPGSSVNRPNPFAAMDTPIE